MDDQEDKCFPAVDHDKWKLLHFILVDDVVSEKLLGARVENGWIRAWVLQDRKTGVVQGRMRFSYPNGEKSWNVIEPKSRGPQEEEGKRILDGFVKSFGMLLDMSGFSKDSVQVFTPPADIAEDAGRTIIWMEQNDLITVGKFEPIDEKETGT